MSNLILICLILFGLIAAILVFLIVLYLLCFVAVLIMGITQTSKLKDIAYHIGKSLNKFHSESESACNGAKKGRPCKYLEYLVYGQLITWYIFRGQIKELVSFGKIGEDKAYNESCNRPEECTESIIPVQLNEKITNFSKSVFHSRIIKRLKKAVNHNGKEPPSQTTSACTVSLPPQAPPCEPQNPSSSPVFREV